MTRALRRRYGRADGPKRKLSAELPDGTVVTRTTAHAYTHVVAVEHDGRWKDWGWTTQPLKMIAQTRARIAMGGSAAAARYTDVRAIPVTGSVEIKEGKKRPMPEIVEYRGLKLVPIRCVRGYSVSVEVPGLTGYVATRVDAHLPPEEAFAQAKERADKFIADQEFLRSRGWVEGAKPGYWLKNGETLWFQSALSLERKP